MSWIFQHTEEILFLLTISVSIGGIVTWYDATVKRRIANERALNHLVENYKSLSNNVAALNKMTDDNIEELKRDVDKAIWLLQLIAIQSGGSAADFVRQLKDE